MRYLMTLLLAGLLAACTGTATQSPADASFDLFSVEPSVEPSADASEELDASAVPSDGAAAMDCEGAFDDLADADIESVTDLATVTDALDDTIEACDSVEEWIDEAEQRLPDVDMGEAEAFLAARCAESTLSDTPLCEELTG